jgi:hypothetical protein
VTASRPPIRTTRSAQTYFPQGPQPARLSLVIEAQSPEPDPQEELKQLGIRHGSFDDGVQDNPVSPMERSNSHDSIPIPIRRRSLLTPGVATRKSSREKIVRKSLPAQPSSSVTGSTESRNANDKRNFRKTLPAQATASQDHLRQYYYDQSRPTSSPLEEIAGLEAKRFSDLQSRAVTPSDLDYSHIGAYKLGSLRITNGTVSPAPSGPEQAYFDTKIQTQRNVDEAEQVHSDLPQGDDEEPSGQIYNEWTGTFVNVKQNQVRFEFHEVSDEAPRIVETMVEIPTFSLGLSDFQSSASPRESIVIQSPTTAYEMAQAYMQEIAASPFSFDESLPPSPRFEVTSKPTALEDNLFDDEPESCVSLIPPAPQQSVLQYSQRSIETQTSFGSLVAPVVKAGSSQQSLQKTSHGHREQPPKPLEKADSGYSSKTSLRSLRSHRSFNEIGTPSEPSTGPAFAPVAPAVPNKSPPPTPPKNLYTKYSNEMTIASSTVQGSKSPDTEYSPATPAKDWSSGSSYGLSEALRSSQASHQPESPQNDYILQPPSRQAPPVPLKQTSTWSGWTGPPPLPIKSIEQTQAAVKASFESLTTPERPAPTRHQSTPLPPYGKTMRPGLKPSASDTSILTTSRRLQKRGPVAPTQLIVQGYTEIEPARVPPVSQEVSEHLEERLKNFPTLTHTYKSVHRTNSKETLATIFSMASAEQQAEEVPVFSRFQGEIPNAPSNSDIERSINMESIRSSPHGQRFSLKSKILQKSAERQRRRQSLENTSRNRSTSREVEDREIYITDLGTVSASLGASPYDLATAALAPISGNRSHDSPWSSKNERNVVRGRTVGMDSQSAAQLARERSRNRENERRRSLRQSSYESRNSSQERASLPGYDLRSKLTTESAPPVPNISHEQTQDSSLPKKTKSPPPVSMRMPRRRMSSPPPKPSRAAPSAPAEIPLLPEIEHPQNQIHMENRTQDPAWQKQENLWHDRKQSAREALSNARQSINATRPGNNRPSLEQQHQWSSQPLGKKPSFEQQTYPSQQTQQSYSRSSFQDHRCDLSRQSYDSLQPQRDERALARASYDSSTGQNVRNAHPLSQSQSYTQMRSDTLNIDRYNGGFAYGYEPGYGVGSSAGARSVDTGASRKGLPGSLLWGVDFSDVPIIVTQRRDELEA